MNVCTLLLLLLAWNLQSEEPALLVVRSQAGADVYWEGRLVGRTGQDGVIQLSGIPYGSYALELDKAGFQRRKVQVQMEAEPQELALRLEPLASPSTALEIDQDAPGRPGRTGSAGEQPDAVEPREPIIKPEEPVETDAATSLEPAGKDEGVASPSVPSAPQRPEPSPAPETATDTEAHPRSGWPTLPALAWWWLALPAFILGWLLWRRRRRADRLPLMPARPRGQRDPDLEAFARTLSPTAKVRPGAEPASAKGNGKQ